MGDGLHFAVVEKKGGFHQRFAVAGGTGAHNFDTLRQKGVDLFQGTDSRL